MICSAAGVGVGVANASLCASKQLGDDGGATGPVPVHTSSVAVVRRSQSYVPTSNPIHYGTSQIRISGNSEFNIGTRTVCCSFSTL